VAPMNPMASLAGQSESFDPGSVIAPNAERSGNTRAAVDLSRAGAAPENATPGSPFVRRKPAIRRPNGLATSHASAGFRHVQTGGGTNAR
jgi:hypothetical protein